MFRVWLRSGEWPRGHAGYGSAASKHSPWTYNDRAKFSESYSACGDSLLWTWRPSRPRSRRLRRTKIFSSVLVHPALRDTVGVFAYQYDRSGGSEAHHDRLYDHTVPSEGLACTGRPPTDISLHRERSGEHFSAANQQSGATSSNMLERPTGPSRDRREWLGEPGPSADNVRGHFTD